jgi:hypothetical protein
VSARVLVLLAVVPILSGCSLVFPITDPLAGSSIDAHDILLTGSAVAMLDGATTQEESEPFASTVDDYLALRATSVPPIEPDACGDAVIDLVLLDRDAGAAGTMYVAPRIVLESGDELLQTGREFPSAAEAETWFDDYRDAIEGCPEFTVHLQDGDLRVRQTVTDAGDDIDSFVVRLEITGQTDGTPSHNEQWMLRDGRFAVLVSSAGDDRTDDQLAPAVDAVHERLVAAVAAAGQAPSP